MIFLEESGTPLGLDGLAVILEHDLFRKPVSAFRDHALSPRAVFSGYACAKPSPFRGVIVVLFLFTGEDFLGDKPGILTDGSLDLCGNIRVVLEKGLGVLATLADPLAVVREP